MSQGGEAFDVADGQNMCLGMLLPNGSWGRCGFNELFMA
jgi:hypothetical protein